MKYSYISSDNKRYSAVHLPNGQMLEVRRDTLTWTKGTTTERKTWPSYYIWIASLPPGPIIDDNHDYQTRPDPTILLTDLLNFYTPNKPMGTLTTFLEIVDTLLTHYRPQLLAKSNMPQARKLADRILQITPYAYIPISGKLAKDANQIMAIYQTFDYLDKVEAASGLVAKSELVKRMFAYLMSDPGCLISEKERFRQETLKKAREFLLEPKADEELRTLCTEYLKKFDPSPSPSPSSSTQPPTLPPAHKNTVTESLGPFTAKVYPSTYKDSGYILELTDGKKSSWNYFATASTQTLGSYTATVRPARNAGREWLLELTDGTKTAGSYFTPIPSLAPAPPVPAPPTLLIPPPAPSPAPEAEDSPIAALITEVTAATRPAFRTALLHELEQYVRHNLSSLQQLPLSERLILRATLRSLQEYMSDNQKGAYRYLMKKLK